MSRTLTVGLLLAVPQLSQAQAKFDILEYQVEGNSLLDDSRIEQAVTPFLGQARSLADVDAARAMLMQHYHDDGYMTVQVLIPEQRVEDGVVRLQVVEAALAELKVEGARHTLPSRLRQSMPALTLGQAPNFVQLQEQLAEVNRSPDIKVAPVFKAGRESGTVAAQLDVDDQLALHGSVGLNSRQSLNTSGTRLTAALRYDDLWQRGHSLGLNLQTTPEASEELKSFSINYGLPTGPGGERLSAYLARSRSNTNVVVQEQGLLAVGNTDITGLHYILPLSGPRELQQTLSLGLDHKRSRDGGDLAQPAISYSPLSFGYRVIALRHEPQPTLFQVNASLGLRGLGGNSDTAFESRQPGTSASFFTLKPSLQWTDVWGKSALSTTFDLQLASGPLLSTEQFGAGGASSVRGYYESERMAEQGLRWSSEWSSPWGRADALGTNWRWQGLGFIEGAWLHKLSTSSWKHAGLLGAGAGLRLQGPRGLGMDMALARALRNGDVAAGGTRSGDWRLHANLVLEF